MHAEVTVTTEVVIGVAVEREMPAQLLQVVFLVPPALGRFEAVLF